VQISAALAAAILSFDGNAGWLNGPPLTLQDLRGKVVLVDFWDYTCVNCLRTLPYLRAWNERYRGDGLVIIGVHTPEFEFAGQEQNVRDAVKRLGIEWPVVLDDSYAIWKRYNNDGWPKEYLFDQQGQLADVQAGEGEYQATEAKIQSLLKAAAPNLRLPPVMALLPQDDYTKPGAVCYPQTAETFVGPRHGKSIANAGFHDPFGDVKYLDDPHAEHRDGAIYLQGFWHPTPQGQAMVSAGNSDHLSLSYHAIEVMGVMRPENGSSIRVNVTQDGKPVTREDAGSDIHYDAGGGSFVTVDAARAYELLMNAHFGQHELQLVPQQYGLGVYSFAFESCEVPH
jgi:thiol-disulfide isomerase/thioredoxin